MASTAGVNPAGVDAARADPTIASAEMTVEGNIFAALK